MPGLQLYTTIVGLRGSGLHCAHWATLYYTLAPLYYTTFLHADVLPKPVTFWNSAVVSNGFLCIFIQFTGKKTGPWKLLRGHCMKESRPCVLTILWRSPILRVLAILWMSPALRVLPSASKECPSSSNRTRKGNFLPWKSCNSSAFWKQMTKRCRHHEEDTKASLLNVCYGSIYTMSYFLVIGFYLLSLR